METLISSLQAEGRVEGANQLVLFVLYEDMETNARAEFFSKVLSGQLRSTVQQVRRSWMVNELRMPRLRAIAAEEASSAHLVVLSLRHADSLSPEAQAWARAWMERKGDRRGTMVALFDPMLSNSCSGLERQLEQIALQGGLRLIVHTAGLPEECGPA